MQMRGWYKDKTIFMPNSKLHAYKVDVKLLPRYKDLLTKVKKHAYPKINNSSWCKISRAYCKVYKQSNAI
jgi:hypothetical protein